MFTCNSTKLDPKMSSESQSLPDIEMSELPSTDQGSKSTHTHTKTRSKWTWQRILRTCVILCVVALLIAVIYVWAPHKALLPVFEYMRNAGFVGALVYILLFVSFTVCLFPFFIFALVAGYVWGVGLGLAIALFSGELSAVLAFFVSRTFLRKHLLARLADNRKFQILEQVLVEKGWRVVVMARLNVAFPFAFLNHTFGLLSIAALPYALASLPSITPEMLFYVYLGSVAGSIEDVATGNTGGGPVETAMLVISLVLAVIVATAFGYYGKRAFAEMEKRLPQQRRESLAADNVSTTSQTELLEDHMFAIDDEEQDAEQAASNGDEPGGRKASSEGLRSDEYLNDEPEEVAANDVAVDDVVVESMIEVEQSGY